MATLDGTYNVVKWGFIVSILTCVDEHNKIRLLMFSLIHTESALNIAVPLYEFREFFGTRFLIKVCCFLLPCNNSVKLCI